MDCPPAIRHLPELSSNRVPDDQHQGQQKIDEIG
jgi:hypothetical protein